MKKILVLTSVLALAACGGGSGGNSGGVAEGRVGTLPQSAVDSNHKITSMASEILVASDDSTRVLPMGHAARAASVVYENQEYTAYRLDDVVFTSAQVTDTADMDLVKFKVNANTGKIDGIDTQHKGQWEGVAERTGDRVFTRNTNDGTEQYELAMSGALTYSDFGKIIYTDTEHGETFYSALAGGYETFKVNNNYMKENIDEPLVFSGRAVGGVFRETGGLDDNDEFPATVLATQDLDTGENGARLTFNAGAETLEMNFPDWYKVTVSKAGNSATADIDFDGTGKTIASNLQFSSSHYDDFNAQTFGMGDGLIGRYETSYYGANQSPSEATGVVSVRETTNTVDMGGNEIQFMSAFGGLKD